MLCYIPYSMSINVHNEEITYLRSPIITCLNIDFRRIKLQQIVLFGVNLCLRLGIRKPSQYHLDALKNKMVPQGNWMRLLMCDGKSRKAMGHIFFIYSHKTRA